jgi:hypothetical protein
LKPNLELDKVIKETDSFGEQTLDRIYINSAMKDESSKLINNMKKFKRNLKSKKSLNKKRPLKRLKDFLNRIDTTETMKLNEDL